MIFRIVTRGALRELRICELVVGPDRLSVRVAQQLVRELCSTRDVDYAAAMAPSGSTHRDVLRPVGFLPIPRVGPTLTVRALRDDVAPDPLRLSSWHLSVGDLELF
ncbi:MAG TPA: hypothetical protein VFK13_07895 [Gemmatimonadaceae bacterium]|nr:hypothetical protein [Gemmatimonadaceae bacterium]